MTDASTDGLRREEFIGMDLSDPGVLASLPDDRRDDFIFALIRDVARLGRTMFETAIEPTGVTAAQWVVIAHLVRCDGMTQTELAGTLGIGKVALGGMIDRLEAAGWVSRRSTATDRRIKRVHLAPAADALIARARIAQAAHSRVLLAGLDRSARDELTGLLAQIHGNLGHIGAGSWQA